MTRFNKLPRIVIVVLTIAMSIAVSAGSVLAWPIATGP
jgi:hypothetical protein